jgi:hypothetical protein
MGNLCCKGKRDLEAQRERVRRRLELQTLDQRERAIFDKVRTREERIAATLLQALCRGALNCPAIGRHQWMHQGPPDGSRYRLLGVKRKINRAAEVLGQQLMLGYAVRCRFEKAIYSAMSIERVWRGHKVRQRLRFLNAMALKIQTCWRGWHWRRWLKEMKANMAASALQHAARCNMAKRELEHRRRFRAALTIQWWWRRRAKMRIWMAIRYEKAARRIQGGACSGTSSTSEMALGGARRGVLMRGGDGTQAGAACSSARRGSRPTSRAGARRRSSWCGWGWSAICRPSTGCGSRTRRC